MIELDIEKINKRIVKTMSTEEALQDVIPMDWSKDILSGSREVIVTNIRPLAEEGRVRFEIS